MKSVRLPVSTLPGTGEASQDLDLVPAIYSVVVGNAARTGAAAAFCGRFVAPFFAAFREAFTGAFFATAFFVVVFLAVGGCWALAAVAASALTLAQRLRLASAMAFLPAALSFRFGLAASGATGDGSDSFLASAHRFRCASPMRFLAAALIFRRLPFGAAGVTAVAVGPPWNMAWSSAIWASIRSFWDSKPSIAALMISAVSLWVGI